MEYEKQGLLHEMFMHQASKTPDNVAVVTDNGCQVTFQELDNVTNILCTYLKHKGVGPDSVVGIYMERCLEYVIAYIAILKAGGAYMPLDASYPPPLLDSILKDSKPVTVLTKTDLVGNIQGLNNIVAMSDGWIDHIKKENEKLKDPAPTATLSLDNLAYVVYSSGTTGKPKGIQCPHRGAVFSYQWRHKAVPYKDDDKEACNIFFVWEMLRPLLKGVPMYVIPDTVIYDPLLLCNFLEKHSITRMLFTPSLFEAILDHEEIDLSSLTSMREIIFCGEVVTTSLLMRAISSLPWVQFINLYSISESHDVAICNLTAYYNKEKDNIKTRKFCPVGKLLPGVQVVILDENLQILPVGAPGEIYIGGPTLARGYLNQPDLNAKRFINRPADMPEKVGDRLYKSGDWGYLLCDGSLEICGRCDSMVKVRGYSIETQAVEAALFGLKMVNSCVVLVMGEEGEDKFLVAYIVPEGQTTKKDIRAALKRRLPFYMIPSYFVFLNRIPILASSGKLDKKALPPLDTESESKRDIEGIPSTERERELEPLWAQVLQLKFVDVQESFFDLGGHSLLATKLLSKVQEKFDVKLTVKDLFSYPTISTMAKLIDSKHEGKNGQILDVPPTLDLLKEVEKHQQGQIELDIQLRAFWRSLQYGDRWNKGSVLLTGASGFLGAFFLRDLLLNTNTHIFCLVREIPGSDGIQRLETSFQRFGILPDANQQYTEEQKYLRKLFNERVTAIKGDVTLMNLGMSEDDYKFMTMEVDFIIHSAAYVNLIYPYMALYGPNVLGTENIIVFASTTKIKPLHYISTDAVFPHGLQDCNEDADMKQYASQLIDGYSQSKWVAEQLVTTAGERGLPVAVYRLGNLAGDSQNAFWNPQDFTLLVLQGSILAECAPNIDWKMEMTPVDFVSSTIVALTQKLMLAMGKVFHVIDTKPVDARWVFGWMKTKGYQLELVPFHTWVTKIRKTPGTSDLLLKLLDSMIKSPEYFSSLSLYTNHKFQSVVKDLGLQYPVVNASLLQTYLKSLAQRNVIQKPKANIGFQPLSGNVAVVTGASSGIGAGIAKCLAKAGCSIAMIARRVDKLKEVKGQIEEHGGVALCLQCDVMDRQKVKTVVEEAESTLGPIDILVNNAGVMHYTMLKNLHQDEWEQEIDINCKGVMNGIAAVLSGMLERGKGHIINISSDAGKRGFPGLAVYSGTKFFVEGMSQALRHEVSGSGVKVTCIQPGDVKSELLGHTTDKEALEQFDGSDQGKILEPEDIGNAIVYAASQPAYAAVNEILIEPRHAPI